MTDSKERYVKETEQGWVIWCTIPNRPYSKIGDSNEYIPIVYATEEKAKQALRKLETA